MFLADYADDCCAFSAVVCDPRLITNYQLPNGPVKAERRWGQRHPQGANLGSNGILKFLSKTSAGASTAPVMLQCA